MKSSIESLITISAESFIYALEGNTIQASNGLRINFLENDHIIIENVKVADKIIIPNDAIFEYPITIKSGDFDSFRIEGGMFICALNISGGNFHKRFEISGGTFEDIISINGGVFEDKFMVSGGKLIYELHILGGEFNDTFHVKNVSIGHFLINGGIFKEGLWIGKTNTIIDYFIIKGGVFLNSFYIIGTIISELISLEGGDFQSTFEIREEFFINKLNVEKGTFQHELTINGGLIKELVIQDGNLRKIEIQRKTIVDIISICGNIKYDISIFSELVNHLTISCFLKNTGNIYLKGIKINELVFENLENAGKITLIDIAAGDRFSIKEKTPSISITPITNQIKEKSKFHIINCDMGNTSFFNTDFLSFSIIIIKDTRINDIKTINGHIPILKEKTICTSDCQTQDSHYLEELYNQLYVAMQKQGNRTQEIKYYSEFLEYHRRNKIKQLKQDGLISGDWYTPVALWAHKHSSNYGMNWAKCAFFTLTIGVLFYTGYTYSLGYTLPDISTFSYHLRYFIEFLLPIHKIELFPDMKTNGLSALIDVLGRITIGFLLYQTIAAFRRFGKR